MYQTDRSDFFCECDHDGLCQGNQKFDGFFDRQKDFF